MALVRYDMPIGFRDGYGRTRQAAQRITGSDAVDWPDSTIDGQPLWRKSSEQMLDLPLRQDGMDVRSIGSHTTTPFSRETIGSGRCSGYGDNDSHIRPTTPPEHGHPTMNSGYFRCASRVWGLAIYQM